MITTAQLFQAAYEPVLQRSIGLGRGRVSFFGVNQINGIIQTPIIWSKSRDLYKENDKVSLVAGLIDNGIHGHKDMLDRMPKDTKFLHTFILVNPISLDEENYVARIISFY